MFKLLKNVVKKTAFYRYIWFFRVARLHNSWTQHDTDMENFYSQFLSPGQLCFDVGANIGNRTRIFLRLGAKVVAIEPQPNCVSILTRFLGSNPNLRVEGSALGAKEGAETLLVNKGTTISSMSVEWIEAVKKTGRFGNEAWSTSIEVPVTTLDALIHKYGIPDFVKIDVEGFEFEVLRGLSTRLKVISIEFTPEFINSTYQSISYLLQFGELEYNLSLGESMMLISDTWFNYETLCLEISKHKDSKIFGDVYIRYKDELKA